MSTVSKFSYRLLPFNFRNIGSTYVAISETGRYLPISKNDLIRLIRRELSPSEDLFFDLKANDFICYDYCPELVDVWASKFRTRKRHIFEGPGLHILVLTHRCNQRCTYCHAASLETGRDMTAETARSCAEFALQSPNNSIKIEFQGGEPSLNKEAIVACIEAATKIAEHKNKEVEFVLCTNLLSFDLNFCSYLIQNNVQISTSLDGPQYLHDSCRVTIDGKPTHARVVKNIRLLRNTFSTYPSALLTVSRHNLTSLKEVISYYKKLEFSSIFIRSLNPFGRAYESWTDLAYSTEDFIKAYIEALEYIVELNKSGCFMVEEYAAILLRRILTPFESGFVDLLSPTGAGTSCMIYETQGDIYVSDEARMRERITPDQRYRLGNVHTTGLEECLKSPTLRRILDSSVIESLPGCSWCAYAPYCGHDPVKNYQIFNDEVGFRPSDPNCKINLAIFDRLMRFLLEDDQAEAIFWSWLRGGPKPVQ